MKSKPALRFLCCVVAVFSANSFAQSPAPSIAGANSNAAQSCQRIAVTYLADTNISLTEIVSTNSFVAPGADTTMTTPAFCRVVGRASPAVNFEVWLPLSGWNGKYQGTGNGGMAGAPTRRRSGRRHPVTKLSPTPGTRTGNGQNPHGTLTTCTPLEKPRGKMILINSSKSGQRSSFVLPLVRGRTPRAPRSPWRPKCASGGSRRRRGGESRGACRRKGPPSRRRCPRS